jgi:hypothetical protein
VSLPQRRLLVQRGAARAALIAPARFADAVASLLRPYCDARAVLQAGEGTWVVSLEMPPTPASDVERVEIRVPGEPDAVYHFDGRARRIVVVQPSDGPWRVQHGARLLRVLLRLAHMGSETVYLHAGMARVRSFGVALVGGKRAGKTSTILSVLLSSSGCYVTNDDLAVRRREAGWEGLGWPRAVSIRQDTLRALLRQHPGSRLRPQDFRHPWNASIAHDTPDEDPVQKAFIAYPFELAHQLDLAVEPSAPLNLLVFPRFESPDGCRTRIERLSAVRVEELLGENLETNPNKYEDFLLPHFDITPRRTSSRRLHELAREVPGYELVQSLESLGEGAQLVRRLVDEELVRQDAIRARESPLERSPRAPRPSRAGRAAR